MAPFEPRSILCPVDLGQMSGDVVAWASRFASCFGADLELLHASWIELPAYFTHAQIEELASQSELDRQHLLDSLRALAEEHVDPSVKVTFEVETGHALQVIERELERLKPDVLVLGSHGRTGLSRLMMGSVAENFVKAARCPVLVARGPAREGTLKRVLVPVNFTEHSRESLRLGCDLSSRFNAELVVLYAVEQAGAEEDPMARLCEFVPEGSREHCQVREIVRSGEASEEVVLAARKEKADLIVMGVEHRPFLEITTIGTTTERVIRHSPCAVLTTPVTGTSSG
jgi:nucleotide-binding universal stress UspA family protein